MNILNKLPNCLQNIIYRYLHELQWNEIMKEIKMKPVHWNEHLDKYECTKCLNETDVHSCPFGFGSVTAHLFLCDKCHNDLRINGKYFDNSATMFDENIKIQTHQWWHLILTNYSALYHEYTEKRDLKTIFKWIKKKNKEDKRHNYSALLPHKQGYPRDANYIQFCRDAVKVLKQNNFIINNLRYDI